MPVAYGRLIGGMLSLITTPHDLIVSEELQNQGYEAFNMLSFTTIAIKLAEQADISPYTMVMTLEIAASTAFLTPVASPVNMLVVSPGGYRFKDFVKTGFPLFLMAFLICMLLVPVLFPF